MKPTFPVNEDILVFAFRYALGRMTTAPGTVAATLTAHWDQLEWWTQRQIKREIEGAIGRGDAGRNCDVDTWRLILALRDKGAPLCEKCQNPEHICLCSHDDDEGCGK